MRITRVDWTTKVRISMEPPWTFYLYWSTDLPSGHSKSRLSTRWCPSSDVCWFINPMNTIDISPINHSYWSYLHQLTAILGAPPCRSVWFLFFVLFYCFCIPIAHCFVLLFLYSHSSMFSHPSALFGFLIMLVKQCHVYHPPVITIFIGGINWPFPVMGGLWHCFTHMVVSQSRGTPSHHPF